ncbi:MAG: DUF3463 domain-containing protein [Verrucomicrobiia bacterium]
MPLLQVDVVRIQAVFLYWHSDCIGFRREHDDFSFARTCLAVPATSGWLLFLSLAAQGQSTTLKLEPLHACNLNCTPCAIPTRNVRGWKAPCYLITDAHYPACRQTPQKVDWTKYGVVNGMARDPRNVKCGT